MRRTGFALAALLMLIAACGKDPSEEGRRGTPDASSPASPSPSPGERRSGTLTLASGESINYWCAGEGSPGVLLEAGTDSGGTDAYPAAFVDPLVAETTVCTYDRPGTGTSDPPPHRRRTMRDLCAVQDQVVAKLPLRAPYLLVGQSGGGNLDIACAAWQPRRAAGLVTIDSYPDDPRTCGRAGACRPTTGVRGLRRLLRGTGHADHADARLPRPHHQRHRSRPRGGTTGALAAALPTLPAGRDQGPHNLQEVAPEQAITEILKELRRL